jgi:hypothetical protein
VTGAGTSAVVNTIYIANQTPFAANVEIILRPVNEALTNKHSIIRAETVQGTATYVLNLGITMGPNMILAANTIFADQQIPASPGIGRNSYGAFGLEIT